MPVALLALALGNAQIVFSGFFCRCNQHKKLVGKLGLWLR
ncbi:Hypothetical protein I595_1826 [Croceitalea dokdonensis DOKDO 023]|uniref:Uncharacterized protein n=1 Tax=Croceitalea dokdonensis DOKDO 023 TaxID=1300341 RepID=A0A0P7B234_9FLAO|nr:Hypothetical protein I595_1826 [Croceitalea dokdonensis DOKDO 023]